VGRRIDIEADDLAELVGESLVVRELELPDPVRLQPVGAPNALDRADADPRGLGHRCRRPMRRLTGRIRARQGDDPIDDRLVQRRDPRWARLVAQQAVDAFLHEALLPAPDHGLALASPLHDRRRSQAIGGQQDDPAAPDVLLRAVTVSHHRFQAGSVGGIDSDGDSLAHSRDSHTRESPGILKRVGRQHLSDRMS